jgi:hypothetical protein
MKKRKKEMTDRQKKGMLYRQKKEMNNTLTAAVFILLGIMAVLAVIDRSC